MSSLRGGFRSAVQAASGQGGGATTNRGRWVTNLLWGLVALVAIVFMLYRFGVLR